MYNYRLVRRSDPAKPYSVLIGDEPMAPEINVALAEAEMAAIAPLGVRPRHFSMEDAALTPRMLLSVLKHRPMDVLIHNSRFLGDANPRAVARAALDFWTANPALTPDGCVVMSHSGLTDADALCLAALVRTQRDTIRIVRVEVNEIGDAGALALARAFVGRREVADREDRVMLSFSRNRLTAAGLRDLADIVVANPRVFASVDTVRQTPTPGISDADFTAAVMHAIPYAPYVFYSDISSRPEVLKVFEHMTQ